MSTIKTLLQVIARELIKPPSRFKVNEAVQHISGGPLMVVTGFVYRLKSPPVIVCQWYDRVAGSTIRQEFPEHELRAFDWYNPECS